MARYLGHLAAAFEAVPFGKVYYRHIEIDKICALKHCKFDFDNIMILSPKAKDEVLWWKENIMGSFRSLYPEPQVDHTIFCDASGLGWGAHADESTTNGRWSDSESSLHINALELLAIKHALFSFSGRLQGKKTCKDYVR